LSRLIPNTPIDVSLYMHIKYINYKIQPSYEYE
jgi:hypothetical protein